MNISYDEKVDAMYITFSDLPVAKTVPVGEGVLIDLDDRGRLLGIEILSPVERNLIEKEKLLQLQSVLAEQVG
ncbi:MAG: DUF2283 domain-containing protein [Candidatus Brocadiales bacterium]